MSTTAAVKLRKTLSKLIKLEPGEWAEKCADCKSVLKPSRRTLGLGYCPKCSTYWAVSVGRVISDRGLGRHIYTKQGLLAEFLETEGDRESAHLKLDEECGRTDIVIIDIEEDLPW